MFYVYVIYSESADRYYIGHSDDPDRRLEEHNTVIKNTYTSKFRPWIRKACFEVSESRGETKSVENYLKRMKSRKLLERLIEDPKEFEKVVLLVKALCPTGWHVPSDVGWMVLMDYLGGTNIAGGKLKATGTILAGDGLWNDPNKDATNETGFTALPGGFRWDNYYAGIFNKYPKSF